MFTLSAWVAPGTEVEIVHYNGNGDHVSTTPTKIDRVLARDIVLEFDLPHRFTHRMYDPLRDQYIRHGAPRFPHDRYVLRQVQS